MACVRGDRPACGRQVPHQHDFGHSLAKGCHGKLLCETDLARSSLSMLSQRSSPEKGQKVGPKSMLVRWLGSKGRGTTYRVAV